MRDNAKGGALTEVTFFILLAVMKPRHGYSIMQFIENETHGRLVLGAGTLYGALNNLEEKGLIAPAPDGGNSGRRKEYIITPLGRETARRELSRLEELTRLASGILNEEEKK